MLRQSESRTGRCSHLGVGFASLLINAVQEQPDERTRTVLLGRNGQECLVAALSEVPDRRDARGIRHRLPTVDGVPLAAALAGGTSVYAIGQWIAGCSQKTLEVGHEGQTLAGCRPQRPGNPSGKRGSSRAATASVSDDNAIMLIRTGRNPHPRGSDALSEPC